MEVNHGTHRYRLTKQKLNLTAVNGYCTLPKNSVIYRIIAPGSFTIIDNERGMRTRSRDEIRLVDHEETLDQRMISAVFGRNGWYSSQHCYLKFDRPYAGPVWAHLLALTVSAT